MLEELCSLLRDDVHDPLLEGVRITTFVLSVDYRHARVHFTVRAGDLASRAAIERALAKVTPFLRARLGEGVETKRVPDLRFVFDGAPPTEEP